jgi:hypothetical protein
VKYDRGKLLAASVAAAKAGQQEHTARYQRELKKWEDRRTAWTQRHGESWVVAGRRASAKARKGETITLEDLPKESSGYTRVALFEGDQPKLAPYEVPHELRILMAALRALSGEAVTSTALRELGVTGNTLGRAMQYIEPSSVQS